MSKSTRCILKNKGFTIVELVIVIVVIAILATITIVAYNGIQAKARDTQLKSDIGSAAKQLELHKVKTGTYPTSQASDAGVKDSDDTKFTYSYNPGDDTYCLVAKNNSFSYTIGANKTTPGQYICLSILAGSPSGVAGYNDGIGINALFDRPSFLSLGADGFLYVKDGTAFPNNIRKINPTTAAVSTAFTTLDSIQSMTIKSDGTIFVTSVYPMCIKKIVSGTMTTIVCPTVQYLGGIAVGSDGNLYVTDPNGNTVNKVNLTTGAFTLLAGNATPGFVDGNGSSVRFDAPSSLVAGPDGNLYVADTANNRIRKITLAGNVTTLAGTGGAGYVDGPVGIAQINNPIDISIDSTGTIYLLDGDGRVRKITTSGTVSTIAAGKIFPSNSGISVSPTSAGTVYIDSYTENKIYKLQ